MMSRVKRGGQILFSSDSIFQLKQRTTFAYLPRQETSTGSISPLREIVKYYSQIEVEKILEYLYERQSARVKPELRRSCGPLQETAELIIRFKESSFESMTVDLGMTSRPSSEECGGECERKG
jgi:hypothetical protein